MSTELTRRDFMRLAACFGTGIMFPKSAMWRSRRNDSIYWNVEVVYGRVVSDALSVYSQPAETAQFTPTFPTNTGAILPLISVVDKPGWFLVPPNNGVLSLWFEWNGIEDTYVREEEFEIVDDFSPVSVYPGTEGRNRLVILLRKQQPEILLVEVVNGTPTIILRQIVGMGGDPAIPDFPVEESYTPLGDYKVAKMSVSRNMAVYPGVRFVWTFTGGIAGHGAWWIPWAETYRGRFWTGGCINIPTESRLDIRWEGKRLALDHWIYKWMMTNWAAAGYDPLVQELFVFDEQDELYRNLQGTIRVISVPGLAGEGGIYDYPTSGFESWDNIVAEYRYLTDNELWREPFSENGQAGVRDVSYHDMAYRD